MKLGRLLQSMAFMMKLLESMEMLILGNIAQKYLIILVLELLLKVKYSVSMEDYLQRLKHLIKLDLLSVVWKYHMRVLSVT